MIIFNFSESNYRNYYYRFHITNTHIDILIYYALIKDKGIERLIVFLDES